ncbi:MAG TPA: amino acid ABC transporter substrate-binding protein [Thermosulfidibacter takaii]|uniref:Amino acid ABC transporter substrate-binding protein n=1 Tax=Thermosulfidibacter takaii TaxID=412593 RepID=A0A7C0U6I8_9BACT|nr:amino acid ABC transporter substrate-binding protein [Thermosulfidibacter takaii]
MRFLVIFLLLSLSPWSLWGGELEVGEVEPLTGFLSHQGMALHRGLVLALEDTARGVSCTLLVRDDSSHPPGARAAAEDLVAKGVQVLTGGYVDSLVGPVAQVALRHRIPYLAPASLMAGLTRGENPYFFRISSGEALLDTLHRGIKELFHPWKVAIFYPSTPGATELATRLAELLRAEGVQVVALERFDPSSGVLAPLLFRIKGRVDLLVSFGFFADNVRMIKALRRYRLRVGEFLGVFGMEERELVEELGREADGLWGTTSWLPHLPYPGTEEESRRFVEAFRRRFGVAPRPLAMHGYAAGKTILAAARFLLESGKPLTPDNMARALREVRVLTPMGPISFDDRGEPGSYRRVIFRIEGGAPRLCWGR